MSKKKYDVHGTVPVVVHITVEAENGDQAMEIAKKKFRGYKLIGVDGDNELITVDGNIEFDDWTEH